MAQSAERHIRGLIADYNLDCYVVFNKDVHLNEYIRKRDMLPFQISGFSGSNATVIIAEEPYLLTDSRYYIQAQQESRFPLIKEKLSDHIVTKGYKRVSFNTETISSKCFNRLWETFLQNNIEFVETPFKGCSDEADEGDSLIYLEQHKLSDYFCLPGQSDTSNSAIREYLGSLGFSDFESNVTGSHYKDKITRIRDYVGDKTLIVSDLDTIAWILNLRGRDIDFNPVFFAFLVMDSNSTLVFTDRKIELDGVEVHPYSDFDMKLESLVDLPVLISGDCNQHIYSKLRHRELTEVIRMYQATKNEVELCGMALAYFFDGIALTELFAFIEANDGLTEEAISQELHRIKSGFKGYVQPSFATISSTGSNAAIVHHSSSADLVDKEKVYLIDCGSHYYFGTTDTTRTLFFGTEVPTELKHDYTLVLQGQLDAMMKVYKEMSYSEIDKISRSYLEKEKKDFGHAVGHGVGHFLCVHEHPPTVYGKAEATIQPNHVFSVEPGYYRENEYGIRIENLVMSRSEEDGVELVNITTVPYQNRMVDPSMLTDKQREYYNRCNEKCRKVLSSHLGAKAREFLEKHACSI